jgi:hypothetical protein
MLLSNKKLKSFGIIEAVIASAIVVVLISGTVSLSSSSLRSSSLNTAYFESEHIADDLMEQIYSAKSAGKLYFDSRTAGTNELFSIDCFDTKNFNLITCQKAGSFREDLPYDSNTATKIKDISGKKYVQVGEDRVSPAFSEAFYSWNITINEPDTADGCRSVPGSTPISKEKCRFADIDIVWNESSGEKHYYLTQYFADWER